MTQTSILDVIEGLVPIAQTLGQNIIADALLRLKAKHERMDWHLIVLGETSTGKSCLINSLMNQSVLPELPTPTTGCVVTVNILDSNKEPYYEGHLSDGTQQRITEQQFVDGCIGGQTWFSLNAVVPGRTSLPKGVVIVDTPGYNSCLEEHTQVLTDYLPNADAIVFLVNYRRGFTPQDAEFLKLAYQQLDPGEQNKMFFGVNFCPGHIQDARIDRIEREISKIVKIPIHLHTIVAKPGRPRRLDAETLWEEVADRVSIMDLPFETIKGIRSVAIGLADRLAQDILQKEKVSNATPEDIERLTRRIEELKHLKTRALSTVDSYHTQMLQVAVNTVDTGLQEISQKVNQEIDESGRFTEVSACSDYVRQHLVPNLVTRLNLNISDEIERLGEQMVAELEDVALTVDQVRDPKVGLMSAGPGQTFERLGKAAIETGAKELVTRYLSKLGGAAGEKAGFVNLAKMALSRGGKVFGKQFAKPVYDNMGRMLKRLGLTSSRTVGTFTAIVAEAVAYLYRIMTWKRSLKAVVARTLGVTIDSEPLLDQLKQSIPFFRDKQPSIADRLHEGYQAAIIECKVDTRMLVEEDYDGRITSLSESLEVRHNHHNQGREWILGVKVEFERVVTPLLEVNEG